MVEKLSVSVFIYQNVKITSLRSIGFDLMELSVLGSSHM